MYRTSILLNRAGSGIVRRPHVRTSSLLVSVIVHGGAFAAIVGFGAYAMAKKPRPVAHLEIRQQEASVQAPKQTLPDPDVVPEQVREDVVIDDVQVDEPEPVEPQVTQPSKVDDRVLSPSEVLQGFTLERITKPVEQPAEPIEVEPAPAKPIKQAAPQSVAQVFMPATRSDNVEPEYPDRERRQMREGMVVVRVFVDVDGSVERAELLKPSRYRGFNKSALAAARKWTFTPATRGGVAVKSETDIEVEFRLTDEE